MSDYDVRRLQAAAAALNQESDRLNALIDDFEESLVDSKVGVSAWISGEFTHADGRWQLGFMKLAGIWSVVVREGEDGKPTPLKTAPRAVRVGALELFGELVEELTRRAEGLHRAVSAAIEATK